MKKLINVRLSLVCALGAVCGIVSFSEFLLGNYLFAAVVCLILIVSILLSVLFKRRFAFLVVALIFVCLSFAETAAVYFVRGEDTVLNKQCVLSGRVSDIGRNGNVTNTLYLENCTADGEKLHGRVKVYVYDGSEFATGDKVILTGRLSVVYAFCGNDVDTFAVKDNVCYELHSLTDWQRQEGPMTFAEKIRKYVFDTVSEYMPQNYDIAYALITGDRNALDEVKKSNYSLAGISHLLVVSGLHVGFIVTVFAFLLKRLKLNPLVEVAILLVPLLFYGYICRFSPPVVRAIVMAVCVYLSRFLRGRYDLFSSLCWAATVILLMQPLNLYDWGFQFSVTSVLGISTMYQSFVRFLNRKSYRKTVKKLLLTVVMSASCVAATVFVMAFHQYDIAILGIVVNIVAIPAFMVGFVFCVAGMLPWVFHYLLWLPDQIFEGINRVAALCAKLHCVVPVRSVALGIVVSAVMFFALGKFLRLTKCGKRVFYPVCAVLLAVSIVFSVVPTRSSNRVRVFFGYNDVAVVATAEKGECAVVCKLSDNFVADKTASYIKSTAYKNVSLYLEDFNKCNPDAIQTLFTNVKISNVFVLDSSGNDTVEKLLKEMQVSFVRLAPNETDGQAVTVQNVYDGGVVATVIKTGNITVGKVADSKKAKSFVGSRRDLDYAVLFDGSALSDCKIPVICFYQQNSQGNFGANKYGNFTISQKHDNIILHFRRNPF